MEGIGGGQVGGGRSPLYHEAIVTPEEAKKHWGLGGQAWGEDLGRFQRWRNGVKEGQHRTRRWLNKGLGGRLWDWAMDEAGETGVRAGQICRVLIAEVTMPGSGSG